MRRTGLSTLKNHVTGKVFVLAAESIAAPRPCTRVANEGEPGVKEKITLGVLINRACH